MYSSSVTDLSIAHVEQPGDDSWPVVCAAFCHMALVFTIMHLYNIIIVSVHSFFHIHFSKSNTDKLDGRVDDTRVSKPFVFFLTGATTKGPFL